MSVEDIPEPIRAALAEPEAAQRLFVEVVEAQAGALPEERNEGEATLHLLGHAAAELEALGALAPTLTAAAPLGPAGVEAAAMLARSAVGASSASVEASLVKAALALEPVATEEGGPSFQLALLAHTLAGSASRAWQPKLVACFERLRDRAPLSTGEKMSLAGLPRIVVG